jgi:hypothetical protein
MDEFDKLISQIETSERFQALKKDAISTCKRDCCPMCTSRDINSVRQDGGEFFEYHTEVDPEIPAPRGSVSIQIQCANCDSEWYELYTISDVIMKSTNRRIAMKFT